MIPVSQNFYNPMSAAALVRAAAATYGEAGAISRWSREHGCGWWEMVRSETTDTRAFVASADEFAVVGFRGTQDLRNWLTNLDARRVNGPENTAEGGLGIEIHEGFCRALKSVWPGLEELLADLPACTRTIFFTGHSLGGALAMLALAWWEGSARGAREKTPGTSGPANAILGEHAFCLSRHRDYEPFRAFTPSPPHTGGGEGRGEEALSSLQVNGNTQPGEEIRPALEETPQRERPAGWLYTFGQPRVGNAAWARWYDARWRGKSFRVVHATDVVARVPWWLDFYCHAGTEVFFPRPNSNPHFLIDVPWWRKAPGDALAVYREWKRGQLALLADHHIDTYLRLLNGRAELPLRPNLGGDAAPPYQPEEAHLA